MALKLEIYFAEGLRVHETAITQKISEIISLKKNLNESIVDYLTRADEVKLVNEGASEKMFISKIIKGIPKEYESCTTLVKFSNEENGLEEI